MATEETEKIESAVSFVTNAGMVLEFVARGGMEMVEPRHLEWLRNLIEQFENISELIREVCRKLASQRLISLDYNYEELILELRRKVIPVCRGIIDNIEPSDRAITQAEIAIQHFFDLCDSIRLGKT